jgi:hypothetical protein
MLLIFQTSNYIEYINEIKNKKFNMMHINFLKLNILVYFDGLKLLTNSKHRKITYFTKHSTHLTNTNL